MLFDAGWSGLLEEAAEVLPGFGFAVGSYRVFEVVRDIVDDQAAGFVEHFLRRAGYWES